MAIQAVAFEAFTAHDLPDGMEPNLNGDVTWDPPNFTFPFGVHIAVVEIDEETGEVELVRYVAVDDCGNQVNPLIVEGQVHGGVVQGVAQALWEEGVYDADGNLLTSTLLDYLVPSAADVPSIELGHTVTPSPTNPMGVKGIGEAGTIAAAPTVMNAVVDALSPHGITDIDMPASPRRVWEAIDRPKEGPDDPRHVRVRAGRLGGRGRRRARRARRRGEGPRGWDVAPAADEAATRDAVGARRRRSRRRPSYVRDEGDHVAIGALTRHRDLETSDLSRTHCGVLRGVAAEVGDNQVRHRGTIGGSAAHGDPASDLPAVLLALDATFVARGPRRERRSRRATSSRGSSRRRSQPDELLTEVRVPKTGPGGWPYQKFNRRAQDWAIVGALAVGTTARPGRARQHGRDAARVLRGRGTRSPQARPIADAAAHAADGTEPPSDLNATPEYREHLARVLVRRALEAAQG